MLKPERLITKEFIALNAIIFLAFCNIAVFFQFHQYLGTLPIPAEYFGTLIGLFSVSVLVIRPIISPLIHRDNAKRWILISCARRDYFLISVQCSPRFLEHGLGAARSWRGLRGPGNGCFESNGRSDTGQQKQPSFWINFGNYFIAICCDSTSFGTADPLGGHIRQGAGFIGFGDVLGFSSALVYSRRACRDRELIAMGFER